jgi:uracil phosphoribosyltransferase
MDQAKIETLLVQKQEEHKKVVQQLQQLEQAYAKQRDQLLTTGVEIQGAIKILQDLMPKPEHVVETPKE